MQMWQGFVVFQEFVFQDRQSSGAFFAVDEGFGQKFFYGDFFSGKWVVFRADADERFFAVELASESVFIEISLDDGIVQCILFEKL